jgi:hypothetical protein
MTALTLARGTNFQIGFMVFLISLLAAQYIRAFVRVCTKETHLFYAARNKIGELKPYTTLLESIRTAGFSKRRFVTGWAAALRAGFELAKGSKACHPHRNKKLKFYSGSPKPHRVVSPASSARQIMSKLLPWLNWLPGQTKPHAGLHIAKTTK